ncbi:hypothetical protein R5R35_005673 [Gryllus longicercus]
MVLFSHGLVPTRFLIILSHLSIAVLILWSRDQNVKSCLSLDYTDEEYLLQDKELVIGLSIALGLLGFELLGFLSGVTMFVPLTAMISIACHGSASILLTYFVLDEWDCHLYWWLFTFCSVLPAVTEAVTILRSLFLKN